MKKLPSLIALLTLTFGIGTASATCICLTGSSRTSGPLGNSVEYTSGGITLSVSAQSQLGGTGPWVDSYLGTYSTGSGVTNSYEGRGRFGTHTVDNLGSLDRLVFEFSQAVVLDQMMLTAYGDTDITAWYFASGSWNVLENNFGNRRSRTADINGGELASNLWAVGAYTEGCNDSFKIGGICFDTPTSPPPSDPPTRIPDSGGALLLLSIGLASLKFYMTQGKKLRR